MPPSRLAALARPLLAATLLFAPAPAAARPLSVMSLNIRVPVDGDRPNHWPARRALAVRTIAAANPDVIGTQELVRAQGRDIVEALPNLAWFGTGRTGGRDDEHMGIFYRRDRLRPIRFGDFWLSDTPEREGSISWGHPYPRMVTWAVFETLDGGRRFAMFNTHLPYRAEDGDARLRGARLLAERIATIAPDLPVVLTGDFNEDADGAVHLLLGERLADAWATAPERSGPAATFHGFGRAADRRIDWVLQRGFAVRRARTIVARRGAIWASDHHPVLVELGWR